MASKRGDAEDEDKPNTTPNTTVESDDEVMDESVDESDDGSLIIADMQDAKETDDTENDAEDDDQPRLIYNGQMTRRQSKQFKDAGESFAVFSVRNGNNKSNKNRTCEYCHVVKATPAALVRHLRKHTGERPFVCHIEQCGKSYKAKRSLNLHQSTHHKDLGKMMPPVLSTTLPTQVPLNSTPIAQICSTPAISEVTKSLLRETLESSRKARDGSTGSQTPETQILSFSLLSRIPERMSTPNLVSLLTTDLSRSQMCPESGTNYLIGSVKQERQEEEDEAERTSIIYEEQAEDLSMSSARRLAKSSSTPTSTASTPLERNFKCDFCNKTFRHEISCINHTRTAHGIVLNPQHVSPFTVLDTKPNVIQTLSHAKQEPVSIQKPDVSQAELPFSSLARPAQDSPMAASYVLADRVKVDLSLPGGDGGILDESNTLPYHITSRMVKDLSVDLRLKETEKSVFAEDGGNRRMRITVEKETVLATRLDGINNISGRRATVFKCHLCLRVFSSLIRFNNHVPSHYDTEVQTYDCRYCEASFRSHLQIVKHLQCHREKFTGLNPSGTALNSSALLLEEFNKKHKDHHNSNVSISSSGSFNHPDSSISVTEPGERANGGYSCTKCQKKFSREYLLQRHMRVHQTPNIFFCHTCHFSFRSELDLLEHHRVSHNSMQYTNLLKSLNATVDNKLMQSLQHSDNNNNNSLAGLRSQAYPLVDMKAFDLRRGEQVEVRMTSEATGRDDTPVLESFDQNKALLLMMTAARDKKFNSQVLQAFLQENEPVRQSLASVEEFRKEEDVKKKEKRQELEETRQRMDKERKRLTEQEKLKQKLAQEGMGDVMVVLPDAPPLDDSTTREVEMTSGSDRPTDLSMKSQIGVGFMARKSSMESHTSHSGSSSIVEPKLLPNTTDEKTFSTKRSFLAASDLGSAPPAKNRRKALKPQRIQHCDNALGQMPNEIVQSDKGDNNNNSTELFKKSSPDYDELSLRRTSAFTDSSNRGTKSLVPDQGSKRISSLTMPNITSLKTSSLTLKQTSSLDACVDPSTGAIDLSTDSKHSIKSTITTHSPCISTPPSSPSLEPLALNKRNLKNHLTFSRSISLDPAVLDSENSLSLDLTSAADFSKSSKDISLLIPSTVTALAAGIPVSGTPSDAENLIGFPRVLWKSDPDALESFSGRSHWNGKGNKSLLPTSKSQTSSPSPAPSPTNSDTSSAEGRKTTTSLSRTHSSTRATSLSRTHSRLSVVNEPLDRNSLCKPKVSDDGRSVYSCVICHKTFLSLSDINRHIDFHEDIRPYKCKYCDYYARTNSQLKVHKLRHEGVREFCCRVCNYKGVTQSDLNRHMKSQVHLLRSNHVCSQCGEGFVTPKTLRDHCLSCTGSADKSLDAMSANDDDMVDEDYEDDDVGESSQGSTYGLMSTEAKVESMSTEVKVEAV